MPLFRRGESASTLDLLVVGLGNPGRKHARDRHNVGFMVVDELARRHDGSFRGKFSGHIAEIRIDGHRLGLLEPDTYMNDSGRSVQPAVAFYKAPLDTPARRPRRGRPRRRPPAGPSRRRPRGSQRAPLDRGPAREPGVPPAARRCRPCRAAATLATWPTSCSRRLRPKRTRPRSSRVRRTPSSRSSPSASTRRSAPSTERRPIGDCACVAQPSPPRRRRGGIDSPRAIGVVRAVENLSRTRHTDGTTPSRRSR